MLLNRSAGDLNTLTAFDFIYADVFFQRVITANVVIRIIFRTPDDSAALVDSSGYGAHPHSQVHVS
jgi:hypothetical protein